MNRSRLRTSVALPLLGIVLLAGPSSRADDATHCEQLPQLYFASSCCLFPDRPVCQNRVASFERHGCFEAVGVTVDALCPGACECSEPNEPTCSDNSDKFTRGHAEYFDGNGGGVRLQDAYCDDIITPLGFATAAVDEAICDGLTVTTELVVCDEDVERSHCNDLGACGFCGDRFRGRDEECDIGPANFPGTGEPDWQCPGRCREDCTCIVCGDGQIEEPETCEPPGTETCDAECNTFVCGNDIRQADVQEECDGIDDEYCPGRCQDDCLCACLEDQLRCDGVCVDVLWDGEHCGGCDNGCEEDELCTEGNCSPLGCCLIGGADGFCFEGSDEYYCSLEAAAQDAEYSFVPGLDYICVEGAGCVHQSEVP